MERKLKVILLLSFAVLMSIFIIGSIPRGFTDSYELPHGLDTYSRHFTHHLCMKFSWQVTGGPLYSACLIEDYRSYDKFVWVGYNSYSNFTVLRFSEEYWFMFTNLGGSDITLELKVTFSIFQLLMHPLLADGTFVMVWILPFVVYGSIVGVLIPYKSWRNSRKKAHQNLVQTIRAQRPSAPVGVVVRGKPIEVKGNKLTVHGQKIEAISEIEGSEYWGTLLELDLRSNKIKEIAGLEKFPHLQKLVLNKNQIHEIKGLASLKDLRELTLSGNLITEIKGLESLTTLQSLDLRGNRISEIKGLTSLTKLQSLNLDGNLIPEIAGLDTLLNLQKLSLARNKITELKGLEPLTNLQVLNLSGNPMNLRERQILDKSVPEIIAYCKKTQDLVQTIRAQNSSTPVGVIVRGEPIEVKHNILTVQGRGIEAISEIEGLEHWGSLRELDLGSNKIKEIAGLERVPHLQKLVLDKNQIREIKGLESLKDLRELTLSGNLISEIKGLESLVNLRALNLNRNRIPKIKGLDTLCNLQQLTLSHNKIIDLKGLAPLVNLQVLKLSYNPLPSRECRVLRKSVPEILAYCKTRTELQKTDLPDIYHLTIRIMFRDGRNVRQKIKAHSTVTFGENRITIISRRLAASLLDKKFKRKFESLGIPHLTEQNLYQIYDLSTKFKVPWWYLMQITLSLHTIREKGYTFRYWTGNEIEFEIKSPHGPLEISFIHQKYGYVKSNTLVRIREKMDQIERLASSSPEPATDISQDSNRLIRIREKMDRIEQRASSYQEQATSISQDSIAISTTTCPFCGAKNPTDYLFCQKCGGEIKPSHPSI